MQSVKSVQWIAMLKHSIHATKCYPYLIVSEPGKMFVHERRIQMDALMGYGLLVLSKCREFPLYYEWCWWFRLRPLNSSGVLVDDGDDFVVVMNGGQITFELLCTVRLASESLPSWYHIAAAAIVGPKGGRVPWCHNTNHYNNWYCFFCSGLLVWGGCCCGLTIAILFLFTKGIPFPFDDDYVHHLMPRCTL